MPFWTVLELMFLYFLQTRASLLLSSFVMREEVEGYLRTSRKLTILATDFENQRKLGQGVAVPEDQRF